MHRFTSMLTSKPQIILCAEDDPDDKEMFCQAVEELRPGLEVIHSDNGEKLLYKLKELSMAGIHPCLITLDLNMPIMGGRETIENIRSNDDWKDIPIAVYTTSPQLMNSDLEKKLGVWIFRKPDSYAAIRNTLQNVLTLCRI